MVSRILSPAEATALQTALNQHSARLVVDGHWGELSRMSLMRFQADHDIQPADGNPTQTTLNALGIPDLFTPAPQPRKVYPMDTVLANVKSAWLSKLNWTIAAGVLFNIFGFLGLSVPADVKDAIITAGNAIVLIAMWVIRTWFTTSITTASAKKL